MAHTLFLIQTTAAYRPHRDLWASVGIVPGSAILAAGLSTSGALLAWFRDELAHAERLRAEAEGVKCLRLAFSDCLAHRPRAAAA